MSNEPIPEADPEDFDEDEEITEVGGQPNLAAMSRRVKKTLRELRAHRKADELALASINTSLSSLNTKVEAGQVERNGLGTRLERVEASVSTMGAQVSTMGAQVGRAAGALEVLVDVVGAKREVDTERAIADVRVDETERQLKLKDAADKRKKRRGFIAKLLGVVITVGGAIATYILAG